MKKLVTSVLLTTILASSVLPYSNVEASTKEKHEEVYKQKKDNKKNHENLDLGQKNGIKFMTSSEYSDTSFEESMQVISQLENLELIENSSVFMPYVVVDPGDQMNAVVISYKTNEFTHNVASVIDTTLEGAVVFTSTAAGIAYSSAAFQAGVVGTLAWGATKVISSSFQPDYTKTKLVKYYSNTYGEYVYQQYINIYEDPYRRYIKSVQLGPVMLERNGTFRDAKWG